MSDSVPRTTFVVNAHAAGGKSGRRWASFEPNMRALFPTAEIQFTQGVGDGMRIAREAVERGQRLVVAVGGDGTVHEVVNGMMSAGEALREKSVLGIWPAGSGSDFARGAEIPEEPAEACALLVEGEARWMDVGRVQCVDVEGKDTMRYFINSADFGIGAKVVERLQKRPRLLPGRTTYLWQTVRTLLSFRNPTVVLSVDGGESYQRVIKTVVVANSPYFGGGMCIAPDAVRDDGLLDLVVFGDLGRIEAIRRLGETYSGARVDHPEIDYSRCRTLHASSDSPVAIEADGELMGLLPAVIEVLPRALRILLPNRT